MLLFSGKVETEVTDVTEAAVLLYNSEDYMQNADHVTTLVSINLAGLPTSLNPGSDAAMTVFILDNDNENSFAVCQKKGNPLLPWVN